MITILADRCLAFATGEKDKYGAPELVKVNIGFNQVPNWVIDTDYFQAAKKDGIVQVAGYQEEEAVKIMEENEKLRERIRQLEEEKELHPELDEKEEQEEEMEGEPDSEPVEKPKTAPKKSRKK